MSARVHVAAAPGHTEERPSRIVQPCGRCGIVLSEFDEDNPPESTEPNWTWAWWEDGIQVVRDPGYPDGGVTYLSTLDPDELPDDPLCDPAEADAADVELFRTRTFKPVPPDDA